MGKARQPVLLLFAARLVIGVFTQQPQRNFHKQGGGRQAATLCNARYDLACCHHC